MTKPTDLDKLMNEITDNQKLAGVPKMLVPNDLKPVREVDVMKEIMDSMCREVNEETRRKYDDLTLETNQGVRSALGRGREMTDEEMIRALEGSSSIGFEKLVLMALAKIIRILLQRNLFR